ncbi:MAG: FliH/SctL family protein [Syntrophomonas sp.]
MSNVIKGCKLVLAPPKVIDSLDFDVAENSEEEIKPLPCLSTLEIEKEQLEQLKNDSQHVLEDTEAMVMELLEKARDEAKTIIGNAQEEADAIRTQVFEESKIMRSKAEQEGFQQGLKQAQQEIEADRQLALEQSRQIVEQARQSKINTLRSIETDIVRLVLAIARKTIAGELLSNPDVIVNVVREAINYLDNPQNVTVHINTQDMQQVLNAIESREITEVGGSQINFEVLPNDRMGRGGCLLESDIGRVDARVETRLNSVERSIQEVTADE